MQHNVDALHDHMPPAQPSSTLSFVGVLCVFLRVVADPICQFLGQLQASRLGLVGGIDAVGRHPQEVLGLEGVELV